MTLRDTVEGLQTFIVRAGFCAAGLLVTCTAAAGTAKIGYGSSDAVLPAKDQELFYTGFELGWQLLGPSRKVADWILRDQVSDGSPLGAAAAADRLERQGVVALVGFPTSHEALLAAGIAAQKKVLGIFIGASHTKLADRVKGPLTRESFASAFWSNPCFDRLSCGSVCFDPKGGHANRPLKNVVLTNDGYRLAH